MAAQKHKSRDGTELWKQETHVNEFEDWNTLSLFWIIEASMQSTEMPGRVHNGSIA